MTQNQIHELVAENVTVVDKCWIWTGKLTKSGRPTGSINGKTGQVHRLLYVAVKGHIKAGIQLHHTCRIPRCVNYDHLVPLTPKQHAAVHKGYNEADDLTLEALRDKVDAVSMKPLNRRPAGRPRRKEDEYVNSEGYVMMRVETPDVDGVKAVWRTKARVLMERKLGRKLARHEKVYYKDGNKENLALSNLEIRVTLPKGESTDNLVCPHCGKKYLDT